MLNGITFGSTKYNSLLLRQAIPPTPSVGDSPTKLKRRKFKKHFFNLIGQRLFLCKNKFRIKGTLLILEVANFDFDKRTSYLINKNYEVFGKALKSVRFDHQIKASKLFHDRENLNINASKLFTTRSSYDLNGKSLFNSVYTKEVTGKKKFFQKNKSYIKGKKDITNILSVLDLFDEE